MSWRTWAWQGLLVVAVLGLAFGLEAGDSERFDSPLLTADNRGPAGMAALATWLQETGHSVSSLSGQYKTLDQRDRGTVLVAPPKRRLEDGEAQSLLAFVRRGGTLVLLSAGDEDWPADFFRGLRAKRTQSWSSGLDKAQVSAVRPEAGLPSAVAHLATSGSVRWTSEGEGWIQVAENGDVWMRSEGEGTLWAMDRGLAENRTVEREDNPLLWMHLGAGGAVWLEDAYVRLGPGAERAEASLKAVFWMLLLTFGVLAWAHGRRMGPLSKPAFDRARDLDEYLAALSRRLGEQNLAGPLLQYSYQGFRRDLAAHASLALDRSDREVAEVLSVRLSRSAPEWEGWLLAMRQAGGGISSSAFCRLTERLAQLRRQLGF